MSSKADQRRWDELQRIGCVACIIEGELRGEDRRQTPADMHHEVIGYRTGHERTIPLCPWHHRGVATVASTSETARALGPSFARSPAGFADRYGNFDTLWQFTERRRKMLQAEEAIDTLSLPVG